MDQSRYRDKAYLVTYELTTDIFDTYNIKVDDIVPVRSVYILYTDKGVKILKKVNYELEDLEFINEVINYISKNGYKYVVPFMKTIDGNYYIKRREGIYVMLDLIEGREADFQNPIDIKLVSKALCSLHKATTGIDSVPDKRNNLYMWIPSFTRRAEDLLIFKDIAEMHEIKSSFDELFLENIDVHYEQALESIELLRRSPYWELCDETGRSTNICHHDLAYHNIIIDSGSNVYFVDFDFCILDLRAHDIANFMVKSIKHFNWDIDRAKSIIEGYCGAGRLGQGELEVLYGFLTFPQDFYEIGRQYYMRTKKWDEEDFLLKLQEKAGYYEDRKTFLKDFKDLYNLH